MNERCFAMKKSGRCGVLTMERCPGYGQCAFYKPGWMRARDRELADTRLRALPEERQSEIAEKYHNGMMPWRGGNHDGA